MAAGGIKVADTYVDLRLALEGYQKDLKQAKSDATSVGAQIRSALAGGAGPAGGYTSGTARLIQDLKAGLPVAASLRQNIAGIGADLAKVSTNALENGFKRATGLVKTLASEIGKGFLVGTGIGAFLGLEQVISRIISAIPELISKGREYAETVHALTLETGATAEVASKTLAIYQFFGGTAAQFETQIVRLSARVQTQEQDFNRLGVVTRDANHNFLNQIEILNNVRLAFQHVGEGTDKTGFLFKAFGQRGAQALEPLIHFVEATDEQMQQLGLHVTEQGLVITDAQAKIADAVSRAENNLSNAVTGFATQLFLSFGPTLTSFFDGLAATVTNNAAQIEAAIGGILGSVIGLVQGLTGFGDLTSSFSTGFTHVDDTTYTTSTHLTDLTQKLADLENQLNPTADAVAATNNAIDAQVAALGRESSAIDKQLTHLKAEAVAQQTLFDREIAGLERVYQLRLDALDLAEKERANLRQQYDLNEQLNQAVLDLAEAQRGKNGVVDANAVASANAKIADIQRQQADNAHNLQVDAQKQALQDVKDYIAAIQAIVDKSENEKAALSTLTKRKARLEDEIAAAQEKGNAQEVSDLKAKLAAVETGIVAENKKIKTSSAVDELTARKQQLADEVKALQASKITEAQINKAATLAEIQNVKDQITAEKGRLAQQAEAHRLSQLLGRDIGTERTKTDELSTSISGKGGLADAIEQARIKGMEFGQQFKGVLEAILVVVKAIGSALGSAAAHANSFAPLLANVVALAKLGVSLPGLLVSLPINLAGDTGTGGGDVAARAKANLDALVKRNTPEHIYNSETGETDAQAIQRLTRELRSGSFSNNGYASGGWVGRSGPELAWVGERGREYVLDNALSERLNRFLAQAAPSSRSFGDGYGGGRLMVDRLVVDLGGGKLVDLVGQEIEYRRGR